VITSALHHGDRARIAHGKPVAGLSRREELSTGRAVEHRIAQDEVLMGRIGVGRPAVGRMVISPPLRPLPT